MKRFAAILACAALLASPVRARADSGGPADTISAKSAVLIDFQTGQVLFEKDSHARNYPASVTKVMTMLLVMEAIDSGAVKLDDKVVITDAGSKVDGTKLFLEVGETRTVEDLLYGVAVESANDAANALGVHIAGSLPAFIDMMNARASQLGMKDTHFVTANGLHDENHYSSAYDIALMSRELLRHETILEYTNTWMVDVHVGKNSQTLRTLANTNKLIRRDYIDGLKTGYTQQAGHCMSVTGKVAGFRLIGVVLGCKDSAARFADAEALLSYGYSAFKLESPVRQGENIAEIKSYNAVDQTVHVSADEGVYRVVSKNEQPDITVSVELDSETISAPAPKGTVVGKIIVYSAGVEIARVDAVTSSDLVRCSFRQFFQRSLPRYF